MTRNITVADVLGHLPANAKQLQAAFPDFTLDLLTRLLKAGEATGECVWDSLSNRWTRRPKHVTATPKRCATCGAEFVPVGNRQTHCPEHSKKLQKRAAQLPELPPEVPALPTKLPELAPQLPAITQPAPSASSAGYPSLEVAPRRGLLCYVGRTESGPEYVVERPGGLGMAFTDEEVDLLFGWLGKCLDRRTTHQPTTGA